MISVCGINILQLLTMKLNENEITKGNSAKFLWGIIDEKVHRKIILKSQKIKLLKLWEFFIGSVICLISRTWLQKVCFSFIHSYINYANIVWASTFRTKLKGILKKQKDTARIIFFWKQVGPYETTTKRNNSSEFLSYQHNSNYETYVQN